MKRYLLIMIMAVMANLAYSQSFFKPVTPVTMSEKGFKEGAVSQWQFRYDMGLSTTAFKMNFIDDKFTGFKMEPVTRLTAGVFYTRFQSDASRDFSVGAMILIPITDSQYGIAVAGAYSIFKVGFGYDFGQPFKTGVYFMPGIVLDVFNNFK